MSDSIPPVIPVPTSPKALSPKEIIESLDIRGVSIQNAEKEAAIEALTLEMEDPDAAVLAELPESTVTELEEKESNDVRMKLSKLGVGGKIKAALLGNGACRAILIRDTNKIVQLCVLKNARITAGEVEEFAGNPNLSDQILRTIGNTTGWMKTARAKIRLVTNPKTPMDLSLRWLKYLTGNDLKNIARSKNIPSAVVNAAKKMVSEQQK